MNVIYLYSHVMPYTIEGLRALLKIADVNIHLVHYPIAENAPYQLSSIERLIYHNKDKLSTNDIINLIRDLEPKYIFITGWANKEYLVAAKYARIKGIPVITGCDTPWRGDLRQIIAVIFSKYLIRKYFDFIMVPGLYQYEYARYLGYHRKNILYPLYAADLTLFNNSYKEYLHLKKNKYPHNILYVGRFEKIKGVKLLLDAFKSIKLRKGWTLTLIGNGSLKEELKRASRGCNYIIVKDFKQPLELVSEIANAGFFCLPSLKEPWGVVIQEFAAGGLPLLTSDICGASTQFLKESYNGYQFNPKDIESLKHRLVQLFNMTDEELMLFSGRSNSFAQTISPEMYAANFLRFL